MKKLLGILVLGLLLSSKAFAGCREDIKMSWFINESKTAAVFDFQNTGSKSIKLTSHAIYDSDKEKIKRDKMSVYLASGEKRRLFIYSNHVRYATGGAYQCIYDKPYGKSSTKSTKSKKSGFKWWYLLFIPVALVIIGAIFGENKQGSKSKIASGENFIVDVWEGKKSLGESFWLYFVVINGVISFGSGYFAEINDNNIFLVAALASNIWAGVGTWNSSTNYQLTKIKKKKPHGWAYAAKVVIVLNFLSLGGQLILLFNT